MPTTTAASPSRALLPVAPSQELIEQLRAALPEPPAARRRRLHGPLGLRAVDADDVGAVGRRHPQRAAGRLLRAGPRGSVRPCRRLPDHERVRRVRGGDRAARGLRGQDRRTPRDAWTGDRVISCSGTDWRPTARPASSSRRSTSTRTTRQGRSGSMSARDSRSRPGPRSSRASTRPWWPASSAGECRRARQAAGRPVGAPAARSCRCRRRPGDAARPGCRAVEPRASRPDARGGAGLAGAQRTVVRVVRRLERARPRGRGSVRRERVPLPHRPGAAGRGRSPTAPRRGRAVAARRRQPSWR